MNVQCAFLRAPWQVKLDDVELPDTPPVGQCLIRVRACGVCGTDLSAMEQGDQWRPFGHEVAGEVEAVGHGVAGLEVGQRVVLESASFCGRCEWCRNGRVDLCNRAPNFWGGSTMGFSTHMLAPACCVVPYDGLAPEQACQAEPAGVAIDMVRTADIALGETVAVVGLGPIGLAAAALAMRRGASRVLCVGRSANRARLAVAKSLGTETLAWDRPLDEASDLAKQFDHVLLSAPVDVISPALSLLRYGGRLTYIGIGTGGGTVSFDANDFHFRKLQLRSSFASPALYFPMALDLMRTGAIPSTALISHTRPLAEIGEAIALCRRDKGSVVKMVITA